MMPQDLAKHRLELAEEKLDVSVKLLGDGAAYGGGADGDWTLGAMVRGLQAASLYADQCQMTRGTLSVCLIPKGKAVLLDANLVVCQHREKPN